ncbi:MAG TPA: DNA polymerase I [Blastocatellia bacterium]
MPQKQRKRLFLVDAMSQIYRAYYALPSLSNSRGLPTNAVYGFTMMLRKLVATEKPDYLGVAFDGPERTFRHDVYESYKATRTAMPDDLTLQLPYINRLCQALRVPIIRERGYEADDIIGTLAAKADGVGLDVVIVTNDKDLSQLVTDRVKVLRTERTGEMKMLDAKGVEEKMGVPPSQVVELLGLWGDTIDNIPGAPGIGEKGAKQIIQQYGTVENAIAHADEIARKNYRESLKNNVELIRKSRELVKIACEMPIDLDLGALVYEEPDRRAAYELFSELEFAQLSREFSDSADESKPPATVAVHQSGKAAYSRIAAGAELDRLVEELWDKESIGLAIVERDGAVAGIALAMGQMKAALVAFEKLSVRQNALQKMKEVLENGIVRKVIHDWKGALTALDCMARRPEKDDGPLMAFAAEPDGGIQDFTPAIRIEGVEDDTLIASYLLDPNRANYRPKELAREHLGLEMADIVDGFDEDESRALQTADVTLQLAGVLREKIKDMKLESVYREMELPLVEILFDMERTGVRIDLGALAEASREMERELKRLTKEIYEMAGEEFNINSPSQLGDVFEKLNFEVGKRTRTGKISTSADVLEELAAKYDLPRKIIEYREIAKLKNTYCDALPKLIDPRTGRIHTTLNQAVSATGRLSSQNPNLQNIPIKSELGRRIRAAFVASPGYKLMSADYSQIELRVFAHVTEDPAMTEAFNRGEDIHARTARDVFGAKTREDESRVRRLAKVVNFAIPYVIGPFGLAQRTGLTRGQAKKVIEDYYETYTGVRRYMEELPREVRKSGLVRTIFGRIRPIPDINNKSHALRSRAEREAINAPIQGTAADLVKIAMIRVHERLRREKFGARMILQVHDELLLEVPEKEVDRATEVVRDEMESVYELTVPLVVDVGVGDNWMEAKP